MSTRGRYPSPDPLLQRERIHTDFTEARNTSYSGESNRKAHATNALSPVSLNTMNSLKSTSGSSKGALPTSKSLNGTIRSVPPEPLHLDTYNSSADEDRRTLPERSDSTAQSNSKKLYGLTPTSQPPLTWQNNLPVSNGLVRTISSEFGPTRNYSNSNLRSTEEISSSSNGLASPDSSNPQWSSAIGRANLGKSGRVIERLMGDNDMLKRDLQIERLRAEESKQAVKMVEARMEDMVLEFESKLHEAAVNSTLLKRRERMVAELKAQVDNEKLRAEKALEREQNWKDALEEKEWECKRQVEEAQMYAAMMEGRINTMSDHWKDQGVEVDNTIGSMRKEIGAINAERRQDDERMNLLQKVCDQQAAQLVVLEETNEALQKNHEDYKIAQEEGLKMIKEKAESQQKRDESIITESKSVLNELKWALAVSKVVKQNDR